MSEDRITKVQRWLDLIAYLVSRHRPAAVDELMERLPAYVQDWAKGTETARASVRRKFERDKDELREMGVPIETVQYSINFGRERIEGYSIKRKDFYLPYLKLLAEAGEEEKDGGTDTIEIARDEATKALRGLRSLADLPAFPLANAARSAFRKLAFDLDPQLVVRETAAAEDGDGASDGGPQPDGWGRNSQILFALPPETERARENLDVLSPALLARKRVTFRYHAMGRDQVTDRRVHPFGLLFQHSRWYLVGWDRDRDGERMFRVDRMSQVEANTRTPNTPDYQLPQGPILEKYRNREAWELGEPEETVQARARFRFPMSLWAQRNRFGTLVEEGPEGEAVRAFQVREPHAFLRWILSLEGEADIESPPELREGLRTMARQVAALYEGAGEEAARGDSLGGKGDTPGEDAHE